MVRFDNPPSSEEPSNLGGGVIEAGGGLSKDNPPDVNLETCVSEI